MKRGRFWRGGEAEAAGLWFRGKDGGLRGG